MMESILIVDDEKNYPLILSAVLAEEGFETFCANSGAEALDILASSDMDLVLTDMKMPGMDGIELLEKIKQVNPDLPVIMMTAYGTVEKAVEAMQKGAHSYILKPFENDRLVLYVNKALEVHRVIKENRELREAVKSSFSFKKMVGKSAPMRRLFLMIERIAPSRATVLIEGESGTGKELVAKAIHYSSERKNGPFVAVNCAALAETLLESELFGHEKGAFTGAVALKKGRFEMADKGTLFLDEIGELPPVLQVKLLRVLQEKAFERVGGTKTISTDFRLIAATNRDLKKEVAEGNFRKDLFFRLNVVHLPLPPLRERREDIPLLVNHFMDKYADQRAGGKPVEGVAPDVMRMLIEYPWPGNVREMENVIERAVLLSAGEILKVGDLPEDFLHSAQNTLKIEGIPADARLYDTLEMVERLMIERALRISGNVQTKAAELLGIGKSNLSQKIKRLGIAV